MDEVFVDLRKYSLADDLRKDFISVEELLQRYEDALGDIHLLEEEIIELKKDKEEEYEYEYGD